MQIRLTKHCGSSSRSIDWVMSLPFWLPQDKRTILPLPRWCYWNDTTVSTEYNIGPVSKNVFLHYIIRIKALGKPPIVRKGKNGQERWVQLTKLFEHINYIKVYKCNLWVQMMGLTKTNGCSSVRICISTASVCALSLAENPSFSSLWECRWAEGMRLLPHIL